MTSVKIKTDMFKIAVIEDDKPIQMLYKTKLEFDGFEVVTADNGKDGLQTLEDEKPILALVDLRMPGMNGDKMLERLRETEWGASIRVIILTNISRDEAPSALRFLNVDRYLVKAHHTPKQVVDVVNEVLNIRKQYVK
jgi:DNA-binding response OmpR family regulator